MATLKDPVLGNDSDSSPMCQYTMLGWGLGDVNAQTRFETTSKQSNDPPLSRGYILGSGEDSLKLLELMELCTIIRYALTVNPTIYTSCIEQFWATSKVKTFNGVRQIQALIDKKKLIITESSIRSDLHLEDAEGTDCLPTATIFEELARMGKEAEVAHDKTEHEESVPTPSNDPLPSGEDSMQLNDLMVLCNKLQKQVIDLEKAKSDQAIEIASLKKRVDKLENRRKFRTTGLKRLKKVDAEVTLVNETQERQDEDLMFNTRVLDDDEMFVNAITDEKDKQSTKIDDSTTGEVVTIAGVGDSVIPKISTTVEETLAQTLLEIKAAKPKAKGIVFHDLEKHVSKQKVSVTQPSIKDKGKGIMQEAERP
ncbi:hypothetical protein Tco_0071195 [Tanacetum coccineum]